ncbi:hypothetical protein PIB30_058990 [Stylosanthes scabra]|uniref:Uncharacterized protein n=1 Tax=Stylosanthes scabra TaxID=79078 RepID=A0ABU6VIL9_9FABA|nr:hypothetical protein [Stylosanthes scabra]
MGKGKQTKAGKKASSSKNQGHLIRCLSKTVAMMFDYLKDEPDKRALVDQMGFGAISHFPNKNLNQRLLKQLFDRYDIYDNKIYSHAAAVKITTRKIGDALGLSSNGTTYATRVVRKKLSEEDKDTHKFFQGTSAVALQNLIKSTPVDTDDNRKLFMRAFICFIQKVFVLPNSTANITPTALPTIFDLETTRSRNWALHVHNFLLQELNKAKQNNSVAIHGCVYVFMIIYFQDTHFGENSKEIEAQPPWLAYWTGETLKNRLKQEKKHDAGLLKTGEMKAKKDKLEKKKTTMRAPSSNRDIESESESYQSSSTDSDSESLSSSNSGSDAEPETEHTVYEEPPPQQEIRSKKKNDRAVVGSNEPLIITQHSVAILGGNVAVEGPVVVPSQPSHNEKEVLQAESEQHEKKMMLKWRGKMLQWRAKMLQWRPIQPEQPFESREAEVEVPPPIVDNVFSSKSVSDLDAGPYNLSSNLRGPLNPVEPELTLRPWLQPEAETSNARAIEHEPRRAFNTRWLPNSANNGRRSMQDPRDCPRHVERKVFYMGNNGE